MLSERELVEKCIRNNAKAQAEFYRRYSGVMYGISLRFAKNGPDADDIMQESFIKIFNHLENFRFDGSLEGWVKRVVYNTAINAYRAKQVAPRSVQIDAIEESGEYDGDVISDIETEYLLKMLQELPDIFRIVFNLAVIEGYSHKEIGEMLEIPESTSRSHLLRGRLMLQEKIRNLNKILIS